MVATEVGYEYRCPVHGSMATALVGTDPPRNGGCPRCGENLEIWVGPLIGLHPRRTRVGWDRSADAERSALVAGTVG